MIIELVAYLATGAVAGFIAGLFGVGGGVIIVPALIAVYSYHGLPSEWIPHLAIGTSLLTIVGTGVSSVWSHHRRGAVKWRLVLALTPGILIGAALGGVIAGGLPGEWLKRVFATFLLIMAWRLWFSNTHSRERQLPGRIGMAGVGTGIGTLSSLLGIGGGTLTVPFLAGGGVAMREAVATSSACGVPIAVAGALSFALVGLGRPGLPEWSTGFVYWPAAAGILLASVPLAPVGAALAHRLDAMLLKRIFAVLLLVMGVKLMLGV